MLSVLRTPPRRQSGAVLLMLMMTLLGATALILIGRTNSTQALAQQEETRAMAAAKAALIAYAVNYADHYGHNIRGGAGRLPCPSSRVSGSPALSCSGRSIGYLPSTWNRSGKRIEIDYLERFLGRDFWYAVSTEHRYNPSYNVLNSSSMDDLLTIDDRDDIVAVILAPGAAMDSQDRGSLPMSVQSFLEGENADGDTVFSLREGNDRVLPITRDELLPLVERRVLGYAKDWLQEYKQQHGYYPHASELGASGDCKTGLLWGQLSLWRGNCAEAAFGELVSDQVPKSRLLNEIWFAKSDWPSHLFYHVDEHCVAAATVGWCDGIDDPPHALTVNGRSVEVLLISVGKPIVTASSVTGQDRLEYPDKLSSYLDTGSLTDGDLQYDFSRLSELSNDQYVVIEP